MNIRLRRTAATLATGLLAVGALGTAIPSASAVDGCGDGDFVVVGTSDVFDSNLVQSVIKPGFEAANPGITLCYVSKGTGAAITYAEAGTASAMIVHAAALENQFVAGGYSLEPAGRSVFWGDFVLAGPKTSDPAGVLSGGAHDIVTAYEKVAAAGALHTAEFVSRGGTPGTTVQEHAIWGLSGAAPLCTVSVANGGGQSPYNGTGAGCATAGTYPDWYHATGFTQGANVINANACNYSSASCYVFTDRGTFNYLEAQGSIPNLRVMTRTNDTSARGGLDALVNAFHAYAVNPAGPGISSTANINTGAAVKLLDWMTSPAGQQAIGGYLATDPPFLPAATPKVTLTQTIPSSIAGTGSVTVSGSLAHKIPGYPALSGMPVQLLAGGQPVASATTGAGGSFTLSAPLGGTTAYTLSVPGATRLENGSLTPTFSDLLTATAIPLGTTSVYGVLASVGHKLKGHKLRLRGALSPASTPGATLTLYRAKVGKKLKAFKTKALATGTSVYSTKWKFPKGHWKYVLVYENPGVVAAVASKTYKVRVR